MHDIVFTEPWLYTVKPLPYRICTFLDTTRVELGLVLMKDGCFRLGWDTHAYFVPALMEV